MDFEKLFIASGGQPIPYKGRQIKTEEVVHLPQKTTLLRFTFIKTRSRWMQGIFLWTYGFFQYTDSEQKSEESLRLWAGIEPKVVDIRVTSYNQIMYIYNIWGLGDGVLYAKRRSAALYTKQHGKATFFYCNDQEDNDDFDDLVFKVELLDD